jgi:hypothetical protein
MIKFDTDQNFVAHDGSFFEALTQKLGFFLNRLSYLIYINYLNYTGEPKTKFLSVNMDFYNFGPL